MRRQRKTKFSKALVTGCGIGAFRHSRVEDPKHGIDKDWALEERSELRTKITGDEMVDRKLVTDRIQHTNTRLSDWAAEHISEGAGTATKWSGWDMKMPRATIQQLVNPNPPAGWSAAGDGTVGQQAMAIAVEAAPVLVPMMIPIMLFLNVQEEDLIPPGEATPEQSGVIPIPTATMEEQEKKIKGKGRGGQPSAFERQEAGDQSGLNAGPDMAPGSTPGAKEATPVSGFSQVMSLMSDDKNDPKPPKLDVNDFVPPPLL